jgi:hypothetical protein
LVGGGTSIPPSDMCCPLLLPSLGVGTPVVVAVDDTEGAESVGAFRSGRLIGAIRPVGVVGGKRNVPNWGDCRAANTEQEIN